MKNTDKIISTLFLAISNKRETILQSIIENILYNYNEELSIEDLFQLIKSEFLIEPMYEELTEALDSLITSGHIGYDNDLYSLRDERKKELFESSKDFESIESRRYEKFIQNNIKNGIVDPKINEILWQRFNDYIYSCFIVDGKDAIYSFLPHNKDLYFDRVEILKELKKDLTDTQYNELVKIINDYPERIDSNEIEYLNSLAEKAESFFSLGLEEEVYNSVANLNLNDLVLFTDTNVLFTVLNIHSNPQDKAINELVRIAIESDLGFKFKYLPISFRELNGVKNDLQSVIQRTEFEPGHIKALIESGELDGFSRHYYEKKLKKPDTANPIYVIEDSRNIFASRGIEVYNRKFDFYDDDDFIQTKVKEYYDYESFINRIREEKKLPPKQKREVQVIHDVLLRESIIFLRDKLDSEIELRYLGITLDYQLLRFDNYYSSKKLRRESNIVQPNFISPSNFLRKIRAFLPIKTEDYKRAFISAMTNLTLPTGSREQSINIQRTMSYFQQIGIQDERAILNIVKNELLYKELNSYEDKEKRNLFIQAEVDKHLQELEIQREKEKEENEKQLRKLKETLETANKEKEKLYDEKVSKEEQLSSANKNVEDLTQKISNLEKQQH